MYVSLLAHKYEVTGRVQEFNKSAPFLVSLGTTK
jgi:hypothetical protein